MRKNDFRKCIHTFLLQQRAADLKRVLLFHQRHKRFRLTSIFRETYRVARSLTRKEWTGHTHSLFWIHLSSCFPLNCVPPSVPSDDCDPRRSQSVGRSSNVNPPEEPNHSISGASIVCFAPGVLVYNVQSDVVWTVRTSVEVERLNEGKLGRQTFSYFIVGSS